tara:strand:+ start:86 stop:547 length:462 start_codon:yes stop_codon:yes gene_type:complete
MKYSKKDIYIFLLLSTKINEPNIINKVINNAKEMEDNESLQYHSERWETIAGNYFKCKDQSPFTGTRNTYSYVLDGKEYIYEKDRNLDYYKETGVSFQTRDLLLEIIRNELLTWPDTKDQYVNNLSNESKEMREDDDKLYYPLSKLILKSMTQ